MEPVWALGTSRPSCTPKAGPASIPGCKAGPGTVMLTSKQLAQPRTRPWIAALQPHDLGDKAQDERAGATVPERFLRSEPKSGARRALDPTQPLHLEQWGPEALAPPSTPVVFAFTPPDRAWGVTPTTVPGDAHARPCRFPPLHARMVRLVGAAWTSLAGCRKGVMHCFAVCTKRGCFQGCPPRTLGREDEPPPPNNSENSRPERCFQGAPFRFLMAQRRLKFLQSAAN